MVDRNILKVKKNIGVNNLLLSLTDQALISLGNFLLILFLTRNLAPTDMGAVGYVLTIYMLLLIINNAVIFQYASYNAYIEDSLKKYLNFLFFVQLVVIVLSIIFVSLLLPLIFDLSSYEASLSSYFGICFYLVFQQIADFNRRCCYIEGKNFIVLLLGLILYLPRVIALMFYEFKEIENVFYFLGSTALLQITVHIFINGARLPAVLNNISLKKLSDHFFSAKWLIFSGPLVWAWGAIPNFCVGIFGDMVLVSIIVALRSVANIGNVLMELIETVFAPYAGKRHANGNDFISTLAKTKLFGFALWLIVLIFLITRGDFLLETLYGESWAAYSMLIIIIWSAQLFIFMFRMDFVRHRTIGNSKNVFSAYFFGLLSAIIFSPVLISFYGLFGASMSLLLSSIIIFSSQRILGFKKAVFNG